MTQTEIAKKTGYTQAHVSMVLSGKRKGTRGALQIIAEAAGCDVEKILKFREYKKRNKRIGEFIGGE